MYIYTKSFIAYSKGYPNYLSSLKFNCVGFYFKQVNLLLSFPDLQLFLELSFSVGFY